MMRTTAKTISRILGGAGGTTHEPSMRARISLGCSASSRCSVRAVKLASLGSTLLIASIFGTGDDLDAFFIAFMVPAFAMTVIAGSFSSAMVPTYVRVMQQEGKPQAQALLSRIMVLAAVLLCGTTAVAAVIMPYFFPVLASGFSTGKILLTRNLFFVLLPLISVKGMAVIYASIMHAHISAFRAGCGFAPVSVPVSSVVVILLWVDDSSQGSYAVAVGTVVGMLGELVVVAWGVKRQERRYRSASILQKCFESSGHFAVPADGRRRSCSLAVATFVDQSMAASLASGSVASLNYGSRLVGGCDSYPCRWAWNGSTTVLL